MGFVRKTKTAGKWFSVNEIVRNHPRTKDIINGNADVQRVLSNMNGIMVEIASQSGVVDLPGPADGTLQGNGFPVPKIVWMGTLPYDIHAGPDSHGRYVKVHEAAWRLAAKELRDRVYAILESVRLAADVLDAPTGDAPNPGGQVQ